MDIFASAAKFLDAKYPGWAEWIDLDRLDQGRYETCVSGQIADHLGIRHERVLYRVLADEWSAIIGESIPTNYGHETAFGPFGKQGTDKWEAAIRARLPKPVPIPFPVVRSLTARGVMISDSGGFRAFLAVEDGHPVLYDVHKNGTRSDTVTFNLPALREALDELSLRLDKASEDKEERS